MSRRQFFALPSDLLSVFDRAEAKGPFSYTLTGLFEKPQLQVYSSGANLPSLHLPAASQSHVCATYLVTPAALRVTVRSVPQRAGGVRYAVDQLMNADSTTFTHGGLHSPEVLISGQVATVSDTQIAKKIQSAFSNAIAKLFSRVNAVYVGPGAFELLQRGCRLTFNARAPREYDLERPRAGA